MDDEDLVRATTADILADLGFEVHEAGSAQEALQLIDRGLRPELLVTDHLMPGMSGIELARIVQAQLSGVPVLIISGYADVGGISPDLPRLTKPYRAGDLAASLDALTGPPLLGGTQA